MKEDELKKILAAKYQKSTKKELLEILVNKEIPALKTCKFCNEKSLKLYRTLKTATLRYAYGGSGKFLNICFCDSNTDEMNICKTCAIDALESVLTQLRNTK